MDDPAVVRSIYSPTRKVDDDHLPFDGLSGDFRPTNPIVVVHATAHVVTLDRLPSHKCPRIWRGSRSPRPSDFILE